MSHQLSFKHALFNEPSSVSTGSRKYPLKYEWAFYSHLPHDTDWTLNSYKRVFDMSSLEDAISLFEHIPKIVVERCMLFVMKSHIKPIWEDPLNKDGSCFSFKVAEDKVYDMWKSIHYLMIGGQLGAHIKSFSDKINGISISPKKGFCIIKIWMETKEFTDPSIFNPHFESIFKGIENNAIYKENAPEY